MTSVATPTPSSMPQVPDCGEQVKALMKEFTDIRGIQSAFNAFMVHDEKYTQDMYSSVFSRLQKIFEDGSMKDTTESGVKQVIAVAGSHNSTNVESIDMIMKMLETLINKSVIPARLTCETLLESEKMTYKNTKFWISSFILIRNVIDKVDYKGVREIMKTCLEKISQFPVQVPQPYLPQLNAIVRLLTHIFDRNACLLPAYFIVNEILKSFPEHRDFPHWSISRLLGNFVDSFRPIAQIVSVIGRSNMVPIVEHSGHAGFLIHSWKLDSATLGFIFKGNLPYDKELLQPQKKLLRYILQQPYSRDMACAILSLQKQNKVRCIALEERLVELIVIAMEKTEIEMNLSDSQSSGLEDVSGKTLWLWQHLSTQLIFFVLFQFSSFPHIVMAVHDRLVEVKLFKGRDFLMWILLQFISGSIQKNPLSDFLPVLRLYDLLYPEKEQLPLPDLTKPYCTCQMAATCICIHVLKKAQTEDTHLPRPLPIALKSHYDYLQILVSPGSSQPQLQMNDFRIALLCNAFSTNQEHFSRPMAALVEVIGSTGTSGSTQAPIAPLSVQVLDSLTVHTKMSLIHNIVTHIMKTAQSKSTQGLAPALIETYARLLVYMEIESLGIKGFIGQLLPAVYKSQAWGILHTLLEMFCYRLHHIQPHYRAQLLSLLHNLAANAHTNLTQLHLCVEMTALRIITGFNSVDVHTQLSRVLPESKNLVSVESEELNRALVLTIARAIHVTGSDCNPQSGTWFRDILSAIMQNTPHTWSAHTLQCFPPALAEFFHQNQVPKENKQQLKNMVEEEYRNWNSMSSNENDLIEHFSSKNTPPLFLCIVWKMILETERINPIAFKILERIGPKGLSAHLRKFCDYIVNEFVHTAGNQVIITKYADAVLSLVWKFNVVPFDRLLLCLALRTLEGSEVQLCFFLLHLLMVKPAEFRNRIQDFVKENSPEHWKQSNWHEKHKNFNQKFPETFVYDDQGQTQLPVYFGNVCLRFLPVLDIVIHRFLENNVAAIKSLELILEHMGPLYKFHDRPITYLYNTMHYYETRLKEKPSLKKRLVTAVLGSLKGIKPKYWALTDQYIKYLQSGPTEVNWKPDMDYYTSILHRFVEVIEGRKRFFSGVDWRYNEFPNPAAHVLHSTCVEIMALPVESSEASTALIDVVMQRRYTFIAASSSSDTSSSSSTTSSNNDIDIECWFNATGLVLVSLPESYWLTVHEKLVGTIEKLVTWNHKHSPLVLFNFRAVHDNYLYNEYASLLGIIHAVWHHLGTGHIHHVHTLLTEKCMPIVKTEIQLLYVLHMIGPFLQRFNGEKPQMVCRITIALYDMLENVDKATPQDTPLIFMDVICDLLYHIKYMFTGDIVKNEVEAKIRNLRPVLRLRLRFITQLKIEDIPTTQSSAVINTSVQQS